MTDLSTQRLTSLDEHLPEDRQLVVSCFDAHQTIGGGLFAIGRVVEDVDRVSSSGLHAADGLLYRCLWSADGSPAELVVYDASGVRRYHRLDGVSAPHDILAVDGDVLVVATTQNEVHRVAPGGEVVTRWRAPGEADSWHLNSLARYGERIAVCGFGEFLRRRGWDEEGRPASGRVVDLETGEPLLDGLRAPHNPHHEDGTWIVCDSAAGDVVEIAEATGEVTRRLALPGWPRGLAVTDRYLFVGLSPHRHAATSVETAGVAVVDRAEWALAGVVDLPAREVYALAIAPVALVDGARLAFGANATRAHEQGQRAMFERLGVRPRRLWAIGDPLSDAECRAVVALARPVEDGVEAGSLLTLECTVRNVGPGLLTPAPPYPVRVGPRWYDAGGAVVPTQTINAALPRSLPPESVTAVTVRARVPSQPGTYTLRVTLAQDGGLAFDELDEAGALDVRVRAQAHRVDDGPLTVFGLYPSEIQAARAAHPTARAMVQALLTRPGGGPRALTYGLIEDRGRDAFVQAVAAVLRASPSAVEHVVDDALATREEVLLTGAEAVALALARARAGIAFAYAGTSELALCDALARLHLLVNGRGDRESMFEAGGASRLRPGNGVAVLHAARGLTNALGALADIRRNEVGVLTVVGMPSTGSAPFLPPHGEPDLLPAAGHFAKSWYQAGPVPADAAGRDAAAAAFAEGLARSLRDVHQRPHGPVLFGLPQDVAEAAWVPLAAIAGIGAEPSVRHDADALAAARALVHRAERPVVLVDDYALVHEGVRPALAAFCARTGAPVLQLKYRRGPMLFERLTDDEVPGFLGWYDPGDPAHQALLDAADLLVTVEDRNMYPRVIGTLPPCRKVALTSNPEAVRKNGYLGADDVLVDGDVVTALTDLAGGRDDGRARERWYDVPERDRPRGPEVPAAAAVIRTGVARAIGDVATRSPKPVVLVDDSQMFGGLLAEEYDVLPPGMRVFGDHGGFVGGGITVATGLALGEPSVKVLCSLGDQGFTNSMQGLVAAVQEGAPVTFLVCNNGGSVSLRKQSRPSGWLDGGTNVYLDNAGGMNYTDIATALGVQSWRVDLCSWLDRDRTAMQLDTLTRALRAAAEHGGPTLVELLLPSEPDFWTGVWITEGFERASQPVAQGAARA